MSHDTPNSHSPDTLRGGQRAPESAEDPLYLLVFEASSSRVFELPRSGRVVVGRGEGVALQLSEPNVSREHCRIDIAGSDIKVSDLGSQNGTLLNGEPLVGSRPLLSGDTIAVGGATLVMHSSTRERSRRVLEFAEFRQRVDEELERVARYGRNLGVVSFALGQSADRPRVGGLVGGLVRIIDGLAWGAPDQLLMFLPEIEPHEIAPLVDRLLERLRTIAPGARAGAASSPADGCDFDTLVASARAGASAAGPGKLMAAAETFRTIEVGGVSVVVADPSMIRLYALLERIAPTEITVLIGGETGTGKELAARALHEGSRRTAGPFRSLNCAALQETLVESELFGHERGAFSGAVAAKPGLLEAASGGTLFLDEVGELSPPAQAKLLRALETKRIARLGGLEERDVDIRVVAASNRNLQKEVAAGRFREDLFFRLSAASVWIPPLRDRRRELPILANAFLADACERAGTASRAISDAAARELLSHRWPGNVRELKNLMSYIVAAYPEAFVDAWHVVESLRGERIDRPLEPAPDSRDGAQFRMIADEIRELEVTRMSAALLAAHGNQTAAASLIGMPLRTFVAKAKLYGLGPGHGRSARAPR